MVLEHAVLELDADVDGDGSVETGVFEMVGNLEIQQGMETLYTLSGQSTAINAVLSNSVDSLTDLQTNDQDIDTRAGFFLDLGGGRHTFEINFIGWEGAVQDDGSNVQWGNTGDATSVTVGDATGADPLTQMQCLHEYLRRGEFDSRDATGRLRYGQYADGTYGDDGIYDEYIHVVFRNSTVTRSEGDDVTFNGAITLEEALNWQAPIDALGRLEF